MDLQFSCFSVANTRTSHTSTGRQLEFYEVNKDYIIQGVKMIFIGLQQELSKCLDSGSWRSSESQKFSMDVGFH